MNPLESEIEDQLRALRPRPPGEALERRISAELSPPSLVARPGAVAASAILRRGEKPAAPRWWQSFAWAIAGAASAVALIAVLELAGDPDPVVPTHALTASEAPAPFSPQLEHVDASAEVVAAEDEGLVFTPETGPVRRLRFTSYERHVWTNPSTGAVMEYTVPREDIRLTPIALQ